MSKFLLSGGLVGIPTETVYGLGANALDKDACSRIFEVKGRPATDPLICHVASEEAMRSVAQPTELAQELAQTFWPGPLTIILTKKPVVSNLVTAGLDSVAVRCSSHEVMQKLTRLCEFPIAAPSANPFAYISPTRADHVQASLGQEIEYIIDGGPCRLGLESTIIDARNDEEPRVLRYGSLEVEKIEQAIGRQISKPSRTSREDGPQIAPGTLPKHYSPGCELLIAENGLTQEDINQGPASVAYLLLKRPDFPVGQNVFWLSESGRINEIAANLFHILRKMDTMGFERIVAEEAKELGMGISVNDRLRRAAND